jgi:ATP-binding protein involved in chromosome partitioning
MSADEQAVREALKSVRFPGFSRDIVSLGLVRELRCGDGRAEIDLDLGPADPAHAPTIEQAIRNALEPLPGLNEVRLRIATPGGGAPALKMAAPRSAAAAGGLDAALIPGVRRVIAVASGKGGVGKSTIAVNLAVALAESGGSVGLLDADIYGPSIPLMTGIDDRPQLTPERKIVPFERYGLRIMSLGFLVEKESALIWRGPMVMKAIDQLLRDVSWGELDYLLVDMPPGTGDAQLTLSQRVSLAGAVIVTTPQDVALADARKGVAMFRKVDVPILGIIENMSSFVCPHCSERTDVFGHGGGRKEAERLDVPLLGEVPLDPAVRAGGDNGRPFVLTQSPQAAAMREVAERVRRKLETAPDDAGPSSPGGLFERFRSALGG